MKSQYTLRLAILLLFFAVPTRGAEQREAADPVQSVQVQQALRLFQEWADVAIAFEKIPGASIGFVADQKLAWSKGFGYADMATKRPVTPETVYGICSISKLFTAISVMQQRDAGKLHLDDPVSEYLPYIDLAPASKDSPAPTVASCSHIRAVCPGNQLSHIGPTPILLFQQKNRSSTGFIRRRCFTRPIDIFNIRILV